jgi:hypothetical protein
MQTEVRQANGKITFYIFNKDFSVFTMKKKCEPKEQEESSLEFDGKGERAERPSWLGLKLIKIDGESGEIMRMFSVVSR